MQITLFACPSIHTFYHSTEFRVSTCRRFLERLTICIFVLAWPIDSPCYLGKRIDNTKQQARDKTHICTYTHTNTHKQTTTPQRDPRTSTRSDSGTFHARHHILDTQTHREGGKLDGANNTDSRKSSQTEFSVYSLAAG